MMIVGIDVSKDKLDIKILPLNKYVQIKNSEQSIKSFLKNKLAKLGTTELVVFESTGGYEKYLMLCLTNRGLPFHRAHPNRVYHFARGKGYFAKTDRIDAGILARYGQQEEIKANQVGGLEHVKMQELSTRKLQLKELIRREKNRLQPVYLDTQVKRSLKRLIKQTEKELAIINELLEKAIGQNEDLLSKRELLKTVVGVGHEVSTMMVTDMPELGQLNRAQISNLVGVAPQTKDSGKKKGYRATSKGRGHVRKALYMSALVAMRYNQDLKVMYERLINKGKKPKVALVALMRKLIIIMNAMVRDNRPWIQKTNLT